MASDFRAENIQTNNIVVTGDPDAPLERTRLLVYPFQDQTIPLNQGNIGNDELVQAANADDVFVYISGSIGGKDSNTRGVTVFGGDIHVSGNFSIDGTGGGGGTLEQIINDDSPDNDVVVPIANPVVFRDGAVDGFDLFSLERTGAGDGDALAITMGSGSSGRAIDIILEPDSPSANNYFQVIQGNDRVTHGVGYIEIANYNYGGFDLYATTNPVNDGSGQYISISGGGGANNEGSAAPGGNVRLRGGNGGLSGSGGQVNIEGGNSGVAAGSVGGDVFIRAGAPKNVGSLPGNTFVYGGINEYGGNAGNVFLLAGYATDGGGNGGTTTIRGGAATGLSSGSGGDVIITGGSSISQGNIGSVSVEGSTIYLGKDDLTQDLVFQGNSTQLGTFLVSGSLFTTFENPISSRNSDDSLDIELIKFGTSPLVDNDTTVIVGESNVGSLYLQTGTDSMGLHAASGAMVYSPYGMSVTNNSDTLFSAKKNKDVFFYVHGVTGSKGTSTQGVALFEGDVQVSGSLYVSGSFTAPRVIQLTGSVPETETLAQFKGTNGNRISNSNIPTYMVPTAYSPAIGFQEEDFTIEFFNAGAVTQISALTGSVVVSITGSVIDDIPAVDLFGFPVQRGLVSTYIAENTTNPITFVGLGGMAITYHGKDPGVTPIVAGDSISVLILHRSSSHIYISEAL